MIHELPGITWSFLQFLTLRYGCLTHPFQPVEKLGVVSWPLKSENADQPPNLRKGLLLNVPSKPFHHMGMDQFLSAFLGG